MEGVVLSLLQSATPALAKREGEKSHGKLYSRELLAQYKIEKSATDDTFSDAAVNCHCSLKVQIKRMIKKRT